MKSTTQKSILQRFISLHSTSSSIMASSGSSRLGSEGNLLHSLQRKLSEPNGSGSIGHIYKQGSIDLGSRIAHLDYADPKTLFFSHSPTTAGSAATLSNDTNQNVLINRASMQSVSIGNGNNEHQRDSVLASSSSNDSVCEDINSNGPPGYDDDENCCFYERTVEECLEHDFRDSAVYSGDDNERQRGTVVGTGDDQHLYETLSPVASPRSKRRPHSDVRTTTAGTEVQQRHSGPPPPIPVKPAHLSQCRRQQPAAITTNTTSAVPAATSAKPTNSRGWVLQQVRRFQ